MSPREADRDDAQGSGASGDCGHDAAAYVLGALDPEEVEPFRAHLQACVVCRDEVATLGDVVAALPMAAPQLAVDPALRQRVLADVRAAKRTVELDSASAGSRFTLTLARPRLARGLALAAVAAAAVTVAAFAGAFSGTSRTRLVRAEVTAPAARAVVRVRDGSGELIVERMPSPPAGKIYEVWLKRAAPVPIPTDALFDVSSSGGASVDVPGDMRGVREVLVTPEPRGGSARPTHAPVIVARIV